ncbi:L-seryl-tRNA(Ser) seleniumtransferase [Rhodoblastus acidophilus]|uniref:L-seryl-tRNA(Sec) selenium transferase n=1 Tax=Rhodoblastus acidophilus TaxID=1074 RepID=UPI0022247150|nr:L-seryl-tRNA(Sec) selenium transferase [Rhodoblastus acidophilus]MCW2285415.1 L-seryl-tRNA(Ser) seleniumtransferase [Rhodoblastus acidophilus]MCW2334336.1 L-seryl-tRNA(Ser) seleniumtransferase [Rhodoblastus acidophilus]
MTSWPADDRRAQAPPRRRAPDAGLLRRLPPVDELLRSALLAALEPDVGRAILLESTRAEISAAREAIAQARLGGDEFEAYLRILPARIAARARKNLEPSLRRVINATGVIIHTNLGRAPLSKQAVARMAECASGYSNLEFDLDQGARGRRDDHAQNLLEKLFAREGVADAKTVVVNNNAAAVFLALSALARGGEAIVSRGELVEIGGSFRIPDIMAESGAILREVGTTNRTRIEDYEQAINDNTRLLLRVHRSNFEITGFVEQPTLAELAALGHRRGIPVMEDLGSGALTDLRAFGVAGEPGLCDSLRAGVSLVTCSGDKLLGGPQAGLIAGRADLVARTRKHPLFRALRVDKTCFAALEATFDAYLRERFEDIPLLRIFARKAEEIERRCVALAAAIPSAARDIVATRAMIGGGAAPGKSLPSFALVLEAEGGDAEALALDLRQSRVPVVSRIEDGRVWLDLRTVDEADDPQLAATLATLKHLRMRGPHDVSRS